MVTVLLSVCPSFCNDGNCPICPTAYIYHLIPTFAASPGRPSVHIIIYLASLTPLSVVSIIPHNLYLALINNLISSAPIASCLSSISSLSLSLSLSLFSPLSCHHHSVCQHAPPCLHRHTASTPVIHLFLNMSGEGKAGRDAELIRALL